MEQTRSLARLFIGLTSETGRLLPPIPDRVIDDDIDFGDTRAMCDA